MRRLLYILTLTICALLFIDREGWVATHEGSECGVQEIVPDTSGSCIDAPLSFGECIPTPTLSVPGISIACTGGGNSVSRSRKGFQDRMEASLASSSAASLTSFRTSFCFNPSGTHSRSRYSKLICVLRL